MTPVRLALLNLLRHQASTWIAIAAIALSVACGGILLRLNQVSEHRFSSLATGRDALIGAKAGGIEMVLGALGGEGEYPGFLPIKLYETLKAEETVRFEDGSESHPSFLKSVTPFVYFAKLADQRVVGTDQSFVDNSNQGASRPFLAEGHWASAPGEVVLGANVREEANASGKQGALELGSQIQVRPWGGRLTTQSSLVPLTIVGRLRATGSAWDRMLFSNLETAERVLSTVDLADQSIWGAKVLNYCLVDLKPGGFPSLASLVNRRTIAQAVEIKEQKHRLEALTGVGQNLGAFVVILVLVLGGLAVTSMLVARFEGLTYQLAVLRALGFNKSHIARWLLWEGLLMGLAACVVGAGLDALGFPLVRDLLGEALPSAELVPSSIIESAPIWITALGATTASVFIPLFRIYHQDVNSLLRS
jgi:putative ABC transport system permease protein